MTIEGLDRHQIIFFSVLATYDFLCSLSNISSLSLITLSWNILSIIDFLQVLGLEVDYINSVQFSNHTGYKTIKGQSLTDSDLADLMQGLADNNLDTTYTHLLTGYIGTTSFLTQICKIVKDLKKKNPKLIYGNQKLQQLKNI